MGEGEGRREGGREGGRSGQLDTEKSKMMPSGIKESSTLALLRMSKTRDGSLPRT